MDETYTAKYLRLEESYWWFVARRHMIRLLLDPFSRSSRICDIGCSGGALMHELRHAGFEHMRGCDISEPSVDAARRMGLDAHLGDASKLTGSYDIIISSDILEHLEDERAALRQWKSCLVEEGRVVMFVPAFTFLWSSHDDANHHFRRYTRKRLVALLRDEGFTIERASYWNVLLFFPTMLVRRLSRSSRKDDLVRVGPFNALLAAWLRVENAILRHVDAPVGVSVMVVARRVRRLSPLSPAGIL